MLPIAQIRTTLMQTLARENRVIITAPTGTGKSTQVPQYLLDDGGLAGRILILQPRRLAARMLATRVAEERATPLGGEIGFITRFESRVSQDTRACYVTEGVLPRMLLDDPRLSTVAAVVFDEFHERSLTCDLCLAMLYDLQRRVRPDLKLLVMSATLETQSLKTFLGEAPLLTAAARLFPVTCRYLAAPPRKPIWETAADALRQLAEGEPAGDVLLFMPGAYEIRRTLESCRALCRGLDLQFLALHGDLPAEQQRAVMQETGQRRVIVTTNIAETSLTVPGVRHVIDSGLARVSRHDPGRGFNTLFVEPISRHAAEQRAGRAGRVAPGVCVRLWTQLEQNHRHVQTEPEVRRVDLAEAVLQLRCLGYEQPLAFPWYEPPPQAALAAAEKLLRDIGALAVAGTCLTPLGRRISTFPGHPRIGRFLLAAAERHCLREAVSAAALLTERPILLGTAALDDRWQDGVRRALATTRHAAWVTGAAVETAPVSDFLPLLEGLRLAAALHFDSSACARHGLSGSAAAQVCRTEAFFLQFCRRQHWPVNHTPGQPADLIQSLLLAYPDHLARRRDQGTLLCDLRDGRRGELVRASAARRAPFILPCEIRETGGGRQGVRILLSLVSEVREDWLLDLFPDSWREEEDLSWNETRKAVEARQRTYCLGLLLDEHLTHEVPAEKATPILAAQILSGRLKLANWNEDVEAWIQRVRWVAEQFPERQFAPYDEADTEAVVRQLCAGHSRFSAVADLPVLPLVKARLSGADQHFVESMAPDHVPLPSGRRLRLRYKPGHPPRGNARLQELYGLRDTPTVAGGRARVLLEILAPNMRPVQITDDLAGFWVNRYPAVKKELCRRYPKHEWR